MNDYEAAAQALREADAVVIGASNGLSIAEGYNIFVDNDWFRKNFGDFQRRYGFGNVLEGCFFAFPTEEEKRAYWSRLATLVTYAKEPSETMEMLRQLTAGKDCFVLTTNGEGHFQPAGFDNGEVFELEGAFTRNRCARGCTDETFPNRESMMTMAEALQDGRVPTNLVPRCPHCGGPMDVDMAGSQAFFHTAAWHQKQRDLQEFFERNHGKRIVFLELGVGWRNQLVKQPMHSMALQEPNSTYIVLNMSEAVVPQGYQGTGIVLEGDIASTVASVEQCFEA